MTRGLYARSIVGGEERAESAVARSTALGVVPPRSARTEPHVAMLLGLQRSAGNRAVVSLLDRRPSTGVAVPLVAQRALVAGLGSSAASVVSTRTVQRQDEEEYREGGAGWGTDETAMSGESSSSESTGAGSEWSSGGGGGAGGGEGGYESSGGGGEGGGYESSGGGEGGGGGYGSSGGGEEAGGSEEAGGGAGAEWSGGGGAGSEWSGGGGGGEETGEGGSSWWPFGGDEGSEEDSGGHTLEEIQQKLDEGETGTDTDVFVPMGGGPHPIAAAGSDAATDGAVSGFHYGGQIGTVPFGDRPSDEDDADDAMHPHAYTRGGSTGTVPWAGGGGEGKGPKGNQDSGSFQIEVVPKYDSTWGGIRTNASAFVRSGTGIVNVHRDYVTSSPGDQGNGWWVSPRAAGALTTHEEKHLTQGKMVYDSTIQPMLDKIAKSASYGKEIHYRSSTARALVERYVGWEDALRKFKDDDQAWNAPWRQVDTEDFGSAHYPRNMEGPKTIEGKEYKNYAIMNDENPT